MFAGVATAVRRVRDPEHRRRVALLAETPLFAGVRRRLLGRLAVKLFAKRYEAGEEIFHEGDPGRALYVVASGEIEIVRHDEGGERILARLGERTAFGELALIDDLPRLATARAAAPADLYILYRSHFEELAAGEPLVALALCRNLLARLARYVRDRDAPPLPLAPPGAEPRG
jgi:CRP-like cAMP-binding protein